MNADVLIVDGRAMNVVYMPRESKKLEQLIATKAPICVVHGGQTYKVTYTRGESFVFSIVEDLS